MKRLLLGLALAGLFLVGSNSVINAEGSISVADSSFKVDYPQSITFHLSASSSSQITRVQLVVKFPQSGLSNRLDPKFTEANQVDTKVVWNLRGDNSSALGGYLPPGASGQYSWHIEDQGGNKTDTSLQDFRVDDNRRTWKKLENDKVVLYWYDGDQSFGKEIFDKANKVLAAIQDDIGATVPRVIQIFIYGDRQQFLSTLSPGNKEWAGGTIDENFEIVLIDAAAHELDYALSTTPHELTHLVTHAALKGPYSGIGMPLWMDEGLAVYHEYIPPQSEPRFDAALRRAIQSDSLFRLRSLAGQFPNDTSVVDLAYGEGYSVVEFMIKNFGRDKLKQLTSLFQSGTTADDAFTKVVGVDQDGLENLWRKSVGAAPKTYAKASTATPGAIPTFSFSSAETPGAPVTPPPPPVAVQQPTPVLSPNSGPNQSPGGSVGLCGGLFGGMGLIAFGVWRKARREA